MMKMSFSRKKVIALVLAFTMILSGAQIAFADNGTGTGGGTGTGSGTGTGTGSTAALSLVSSNPTNGQKNVATDSKIKLVFSKNVVNASVKTNNAKCFILKTKAGKMVPFKVVMADDQVNPTAKNNITIVPKTKLAKGTTYTLQITSKLKSKSGDTLSKNCKITFTTAK